MNAYVDGYKDSYIPLDVLKEALAAKGLGLECPEVCSVCKGRCCCQFFPCSYMPQDFSIFETLTKNNVEDVARILVKEIENTDIAIDMGFCRDRKYGPLESKSHEPNLNKISLGAGYLYLRAPRKAARRYTDFQTFDFPDGGYQVCAHWRPGEEGCRFTLDQRPYGGKVLIPTGIPCVCVNFLSPEAMQNEWTKRLEIQMVLVQVCELLKGKKRKNK